MKINQFSSLRDRFYDQFIPVTESGCWLWIGCCSKSGYGQIKDHYKTKTAHRTSYELHIGEIPEGMLVCHKCDVPFCVNPNHLFIGTSRDNILDSVSKGRHPHCETHNKAKLTWENCDEIRSSNEDMQVIADRLGVHFSTVYRVRRGETWDVSRRPSA